jgi:hypothetical protein
MYVALSRIAGPMFLSIGLIILLLLYSAFITSSCRKLRLCKLHFLCFTTRLCCADFKAFSISVTFSSMIPVPIFLVILFDIGGVLSCVRVS